MSRRLVPVSRSELIKRFRNLGWEGPRSGKRHDFMHEGNKKVRIPNPHKGDIGVDLLANVLRQARISREEWLDSSD
ncbi:MAG: type II toxin-antitoxin system HicA family toxin [Acidimicrobiaceae bacterium]|nr:type II toxin-antitoxin system HicA family toxin [Acidimicrobiaceae bacterium]MYH43425.1 type II toxin-antitoxin system HicA family toxin [Acidimicrobiaceae bacterium]